MMYNQCPRKFKYKFVDKIKVPFVPSVALTRGNIVHSFLENHEKPLKEKLELLKKDWQIAKSEFFTKEVIKECIDIYNRFVSTEVGKDLLSHMTLANELRCAFDTKLKPTDYDAKDCLFRGKIDRVSVEVEKDLVHVIDWKTGKDKSTGSFKQDPFQLMSYAAWYFAQFPVDKLIISYVFVEHENAKLDYELSRDNLEKYNKRLLVDIVKIEKDEVFEKIEGPLCDYCDFQDHCISDRS